MANVNVSIDQLLPQAGSDNKGRRIAFFSGVTKDAQDDTITFIGANKVHWVVVTLDATGVYENRTIDGNEVTLTADTDGTVSGIIVYN